ncbi:MAG: SulP family inorganic anion transporter [Flavobacteriales bacterium]|nr:SulP family inorganic anion transporter [Flavobacteriales bacterium]
MQDFNVFKNLKADIPAGLVVFLVSLPLSLGIALASGAPIFSGILSGIIGGVIVGALSGSPLGVSGPAAGLAVIVMVAIQNLGFDAFLAAVVIAGVLQLILGYLKAGIIGYFFPTSVIEGMLTAIGISIFLKQIPHAVGFDNDYEGNLSFWNLDGSNTLTELVRMFDFINMGAIIITVLSLGVLILWEQDFIKKQSFTKVIKGPLVVVILGVSLNALFINFFPSIAIGAQHLVNIPLVDSFSGYIDLLRTPELNAFMRSDVWTVAVTIAIVASLETLLSVEAADKMDRFKRVTPTNRELKAQGVGNIIAGLIGGIPVTQVIVRSSVNVQTGGVTKMSTIFHGILILLSVMMIPLLLNMIPYAALAAILLQVGFKLASPSLFKHMYSLGKYQFIPFIVTVLAVIFTDLLMGIIIGMGVAIFNILMANYRTPIILEEQQSKDNCVKITLSQEVSFLNKGGLLQTLDHIKPGTKLIIDATKSISIDYDIIGVIEAFKEKAKHIGIELEVIGMSHRMPDNQFKDFKSVIIDTKN